MDERRLVFRDIRVLDMRHASRAGLRLPDRIEEVGFLICDADTDLSGVEMYDVEVVVRLGSEARIEYANGGTRISASDAEGEPVYLMVSGGCDIDSDVTPDMLRRRYAAIYINGGMLCTRTAAGALGDRLYVNGGVDVYPDDAILRTGEEFYLTADSARDTGPGLYAVKRLYALDEAALKLARERGIRFFTGGVVCAHSLRSAVGTLLRECGPKIKEIPDGAEYLKQDIVINRLNARRLRGRLYFDGSVELDAGLSADELKLEGLYASRSITMTRAQFDSLAELDIDCSRLWLRDAGDIVVHGDLTLNAAALEALDGARGLLVIGDLTLEPDVTPELFGRCISSVCVNGSVYAPRALWALVASLGKVSFEFIEYDADAAARRAAQAAANAESEFSSEKREHAPDTIYVEEMRYFEY